MMKKTATLFIALLTLFSLINTTTVFAAGEIHKCDRTRPNCVDGLSCQPSQNDPANTYLCQENIKGGRICRLTDVNGNLAPNGFCVNGYSCKPSKFDPGNTYLCQENDVADIFGKIAPPSPLANLLKADPTGTGVISHFLSNAVTLIYSIAAVVLLFMFLWAAFEWMTSGGEKEKVASARNKIIYAIIGLILFALAFAIIRIVGTFTGFSFFKGQI